MRSTLPLTLTLLGLASAMPHLKRGPHTRLGCFTDLINGGRALSASQWIDGAAMTVDACAAFCGTGFKFFGVEFGQECYCGNERDASSMPTPETDCSFPCSGKPTETCGAGFRIEIYENAEYVETTPGVADICDVEYLGCFKEHPERVLPYQRLASTDMTAMKCAVHCETFGYRYFGTQWGQECFCGTELPSDSAPEADCGMPCAGDPTEFCGASLRLNVYRFEDGVIEEASNGYYSDIAGFAYQGCYTDAPVRVLSGGETYSNELTLEGCATACADYTFFGVEFSTECYCGMTLDEALSSRRPESECNMACAGDETQACGAGFRLNVYKKKTVGEFSAVSCWIDDPQNRALRGVLMRDENLTIETCADVCAGWKFFGVEFASECFCGGEVLSGTSAPEGECNMACAGDSSKICGGPNRMNLYKRMVTPDP